MTAIIGQVHEQNSAVHVHDQEQVVDLIDQYSLFRKLTTCGAGKADSFSRGLNNGFVAILIVFCRCSSSFRTILSFAMLAISVRTSPALPGFGSARPPRLQDFETLSAAQPPLQAWHILRPLVVPIEGFSNTAPKLINKFASFWTVARLLL